MDVFFYKLQFNKSDSHQSFKNQISCSKSLPDSFSIVLNICFFLGCFIL